MGLHPPPEQNLRGKRCKSLFIDIFIIIIIIFTEGVFVQNAFAFRFAQGEKSNTSEPQDVSVGGLILSKSTFFSMKESGSSVTVCVPR